MNNRVFLGLIFLIFVLCAGIVYLYTKSSKEKKYAYVLNQKVFEDFQGTKELRAKVSKIQERQKSILDSIGLTIKSLEVASEKNKKAIDATRQNYERLYREFSSSDQQMMEEYSDEIWKQINHYIKEYGKDKHYDFIYGATGTGSLMYADSTLDLTVPLVKYINEKYAGK